MSTITPRTERIKVRAPRVPLDLTVESKTIGTQAAYSLSTVDVSRSGLLLSWNRKTKVPFNVNTILEMTIDPKKSHFDTPVSCLGKVVRRNGADGETHFGIQIVQIDNSDHKAWEACLNALEKKFGLDISGRSLDSDQDVDVKKLRHAA